MKTKKITVAGMLVKEAVYSRPGSRESARIRAAKRKASTEAQKRMNAKHSWEKLELMLAANFMPGDLVITLTYDNEHLPETRAAAADRLKRFRRQLSDLRQDRGTELVMIWTTENKSNEGRWHHHCVINATGEDYQEILRLWVWGSDIEIKPLKLNREKNYESLARYMCKEARERPGLRSWSSTRNCRRPETETFTVPDDTDVEIPKDSMTIADAYVRTDYGEYHFIKYIAGEPQQIRRRRIHAKRQR